MRSPSPMARLGRMLNVSEGQAYTLVIGLVFALVSAVVAIPPTLEDKVPVEQAGFTPAPLERPIADGPAAAPTVPDAASPPAAGPRVTGRPPPAASSGPAPRPGTPRTGATQEPPPFGSVSLFASVPDPGAPMGIAIVDHQRLWVGTDNFGGRGSGAEPRLFELTAEGVVAERVVGTATGTEHALQGLARREGGLFVLQASPAAVLRLDLASGRLRRHAEIPDLGACLATLLVEPCELSPFDRPPLPRGAAFDAQGNLFVTDAAQGTIWRIPAGSTTAEVFHQANEYVSEEGPAGIAVDGAGNLVFAVTSSPAHGTAGAVYLLAVDGSGRPGDLSLLATTEPGDAPMGVAVGESGRLYLALSGADEVVVLEPDGSERTRLLADAEPACATPMGVAFQGTAIAVTCQSPGEAAGASVLRIEVAEGGVAT